MSLIFEALKARYGDSLLMTFTEADGRVLRLLVDGGPSGVYTSSLQPRLERERVAAGGGALTLDAVMISHIDEDHVLGILDLFSAMQDADERQEERPWEVGWLLHNSFDALLGTGEGGAARSLGGQTVLAAFGGSEGLRGLLGRDASHTAELVLQSYGQGSKLASLAAALGVTRNPPDGSPLSSADPPRVLKFGAADLTLVAPRQKDLDKLRKEWLAWRADHPDGGGAALAALAVKLDTAVPNLSSMVVLLERGGRKILLTGDARADYAMEGLEAAGKIVKTTGKLHLDVLKVPHHGSIRNITEDFLTRVTADHYVFSGDGTYGNPDRATFELLEKVRPAGGYTVHLTYDGASCDHTHEAWLRPRRPAPFVANVDGIADLIARWRAEGKIKVEEGPAKITL